MNMPANSGDFNRNLPVVAGVEITTDAQGRFNLNALHRASGEGKHKAPNKWLETQQARDLLAELEAQTPISGFGPLNVIRGGNAPGTFAAEELAVSYAGWISPAYQLEVNRTFIAYRKGELTGPVQITPALSREARLQFKQSLWLLKQLKIDGNQAIISANRATRALTGVDMMELMGIQSLPAPEPERLLNPSEIGVRLGGRKARIINLALTAYGYQVEFRDAKGNLYYEPTEKGRQAGGVMVDTEKQQKHGTPVRQLRWASRIVDLLRADMDGVTA